MLTGALTKVLSSLSISKLPGYAVNIVGIVYKENIILFLFHIDIGSLDNTLWTGNNGNKRNKIIFKLWIQHITFSRNYDIGSLYNTIYSYHVGLSTNSKNNKKSRLSQKEEILSICLNEKYIPKWKNKRKERGKQKVFWSLLNTISSNINPVL